MNKEQIHSMLSNGGFKLDDLSTGISRLGLLTLGISLQSYTATATGLSRIMHEVTSLAPGSHIEKYPPDYTKNAVEAVIHLQHFLELVIKDILRTVHKALVYDLSRQPVALAKLISGDALTEEEEAKLQTVELSGALKALHELIKEGKIPNDYHFISDYKPWIEEVNILRNRIMHRGLFVLRHDTLDKVFGKFVFPFLAKLFVTPLYADEVKRWQYKPLECGIDPITEIINLSSGSNYNAGHAVLYKLLMSAAYRNPISEAETFGLFAVPSGSKLDYWNNVEKVREAKNKADERMMEKPGVSDIVHCPVCGVPSLLVFEDTVEDSNDNLAWIYEGFTCMCCDFDISTPVPMDPLVPFMGKKYW